MSEPKHKASKLPQSFIDMLDDHFLEAARELRKIQDQSHADFAAAAKSLNIGFRKASYLTQIDRHFENTGIADRRLRRVGWTKLAIVAPYVNKGNAKAMVAIAEELTAHHLKMFLLNMEIDPNGRTVVLQLTAEQYDIFEKAAVLGGALKIGHTLKDKEKGLTSFLADQLNESEA
jgi:hypothetical protein